MLRLAWISTCNYFDHSHITKNRKHGYWERKTLSWTTTSHLLGTNIGQIDENLCVSFRFSVSLKKTLNLPFYLHFLPINNFGTETRFPSNHLFLILNKLCWIYSFETTDLTNIFLSYFADDSVDNNSIYDLWCSIKNSYFPKNMNHKNYIPWTKFKKINNF